MALLGVGNIIGNIQSGLFTPLAIASEVRSPLLPNVPTIVELGYQGAAVTRLVRPVCSRPARPGPSWRGYSKRCRASWRTPRFGRKTW